MMARYLTFLLSDGVLVALREFWCSTVFLVGPKRQCQNMFTGHRAMASSAYFGSMIGTIYAAMGLRIYLLVLVFIGIFLNRSPPLDRCPGSLTPDVSRGSIRCSCVVCAQLHTFRKVRRPSKREAIIPSKKSMAAQYFARHVSQSSMAHGWKADRRTDGRTD